MTQKREYKITFAILWNIFIAYAALMICRIIFVAVNHEMYAAGMETWDIQAIVTGALRFDTSTVCYLNIPYILCLLLPLHYKEGATMQRITQTAYVACNGIGIIANLCDTVYVPFSGRRTTWSLFSEFSNENNMGRIIGSEIINHWYLVLAGGTLIWLLWRLYHHAAIEKNTTRYYITRTLLLAITATLIILGIRGGVGRTVRPISLNDANQYVNSPTDAAVVLNTPFSMIRTIGKTPFKEVKFYDEKELNEIFNPIHDIAVGDSISQHKNIVIFILESFGKEHIGAYNPQRGKPSLTPFLDSLINISRTYTYSYGNGRKSIDGMPSTLSGIPMFVEPFFVTPAALNKVSGIAGELSNKGYHSAFFHGAPNGSMGFQAFAKATGFKEYYGMDEYNASPLHNGEKDFDGSWAIWDEPFFQYYAETMDTLPQPFVTALFSASSHHPFALPEEYVNTYKEGDMPIHKCIQYTDNALRRFFDKAKSGEWFKNTLFVITADHSNQNSEERYLTSSGLFEIPIIFYHPTGEPPFSPQTDSTLIAQQIDIMPTVLHYAGYNRPFLSFGKSLISDTPEKSYAINWISGQYQYYKGPYMLIFDGEKSTALFDIRHDPLCKQNLSETRPVIKQQMERETKAIIQQYMTRMLHDRLVPENDK